MQSGASAVLGGVGELPGVRFIEFQSTRPVRGATRVRDIQSVGVNISIHAPRVGRDKRVVPMWQYINKFQSTRPVWGATRSTPAFNCKFLFQSTRPVWGAT